MKKHSTTPKSPKQASACKGGPITIGIDLGDKTSRYCVLGANGEVMSEGSVGTTRKAMAEKFAKMRRCRVAIEVGTHSPWLSRWLSSLGFEVIVANARQVQLISASSRKNDRLDACLLARLARVDPQLLRPIRHRKRDGASRPDEDPGPRGAGGGSDPFSERGAGFCQSHGRAAAGVRHRQYGRGANGVVAGRYAGYAEAAAGAGGIADGKD